MKTGLSTVIKKNPEIILFVFVSLLFVVFPQIDLFVINQVWDVELGFFLGKQTWAVIFFDVFASIAAPLALGLLVLWTLSFLPINSTPFLYLKSIRKQLLFILAVLVLGAIVIEVLLKGIWGRARPRDVLEFGGELMFSRAWFISGECSENCSFMSGHASIGYFFMIPAWLVMRKIWLLPGIALGLTLGVVRVIQGGHFPSDVLLPVFVVYFLSQYLSYWLLGFKFTFGYFNRVSINEK